MIRLCWIQAAATLMLSFAFLAGHGAAPVTVYMIGDSTMANKPVEGNPERGWGQVFPLFFDQRTTIANHAVNGRSTKSFIDEGRWDVVLAALRPGDYVFIQFGHNDSKQEDPRRFADANTTYRQNLERLVRETRAKGATAVLCTPVMRRRFDEAGRFFDTHGEYPNVVRQVAREWRVALVDLHQSTQRLIAAHGVEGSKKLFLWIAPGQFATCPNGRQDDTHFSEYGALKVAASAVRGMEPLRLSLNEHLRKTPLPPPPAAPVAYLFSYFRGNGEDGLHLAYSRDGLNWTPLRGDRSFLTATVGRDKLMRDPFILPGPDGVFHLVWTTSWTERGIGYAMSRDLIQWSAQRLIGVMEHEAEAQNCWAPEIVYDDERREYVVFWSTTIPGRFPETDNQSSAGPPKPGLNHRIYFVRSRDMLDFSETGLLFDQGVNVIDASIVKDGSRFVMFVKDETNKPFTPQKNIRVSTAPLASGPWAPLSKPITGEFWAEGPAPLKLGDTWLVYFDRYIDRRYGAVLSRDLEKWEDVSEQVHLPVGARHGSVFRVSEETLTRLLAMEAL